MREGLVKFYLKYENSIGWHDLKRAFPYLKLSGSQIITEISTLNTIGRWVVTLLSWSIELYSVLIMLLAAYMEFTKQEGGIKLSVLALFTFIAALIFSSLNWPYHSAVKIQNIEKIKIKKPKQML